MFSAVHHNRSSSIPDVDTSGTRSLRIGRYELVAQLAQGGMGTVYLARIAGEAGFSRLYAVKLMHPHLAGDEAFIGMFLDEARLAAGIHHSNVVSVVDLGVCERGYFVVMEYIEGCALEQLLKRDKTRPPDKIVPLVIDVLNGLHAAHTMRDEEGRPLELVHRDVSPGNVLIGVDGVARITDFGIAKARSRITSTRPGLLKGKLSYSAPEQLTAESPIDARTDIFAAGVMLWTGLTGKRLFRGETEAQTIRNVLQMVVEAPSTVGLKPPACFDDICLRALERDPKKRFESAMEMAEALRDAARDNGYLASSSRIGSWVQETFENELTARRTVLREVSSGSRPSGVELAGITSLPSVTGFGSGEGGTNTSAVLASGMSQSGVSLSVQPQVNRRPWKLALVIGLMLVAAGLGWWSAPAERGDVQKPDAGSVLIPPAKEVRATPPSQFQLVPSELPGEPEGEGAAEAEREPGADGKAEAEHQPEANSKAELSARSRPRILPARAQRRHHGPSRPAPESRSVTRSSESERPAAPPPSEPAPTSDTDLADGMDANPYLRTH